MGFGYLNLFSVAIVLIIGNYINIFPPLNLNFCSPPFFPYFFFCIYFPGGVFHFGPG